MIENGTVRDAGLSHPKQAAVDVRVGWQVRDLTVECGPRCGQQRIPVGIHNQIASNCTAVGAEINFFIRSIDGKYVNLIGRDAKGVNLTVYTSEAGGASGNCFTGCDMTGAGFLDVRVQGPGTVTDTFFVGLTPSMEGVRW